MAPFTGAPPLGLLALLVVGVAAGRRRPPLLVVAVAITTAACGALAGATRIEAIDGGAHRGVPGQVVRIRGYVTGLPKLEGTAVSLPVQTPSGRLLVRLPPPAPEVTVGAEIEIEGRLDLPEPWMRARLEVRGVARILEASSVRPTGRVRGGLKGMLDSIRSRAEETLERGMPATEAALARGFVLGQDDRIPAATSDDFKRSGLSHLLAVSGQNVMLLSTLALAALALLGTSLRARLLWALALIAIYVPVAGAGPSIQRAGVMGAAAIAATLASRPRSRVYILLLAIIVTLALNPRASAEIGWQLSFAAVFGIALWARPLAGAAAARLGTGVSTERLSWRRGLAEGFGVTTAATLATAPLLALHFEVFSVASLPANLLALPAVAPVMWLGMVTAFAGQLSQSLPVEHVNALTAGLIGYIEQVAHALAQPQWAQVALLGLRWPAATAIYAVLLGAGVVAIRAGRRRAGMNPRRRRLGGARLRVVSCGLVAVVLLGFAAAGEGVDDGPGPQRNELRLSVLDIGQGDAILIEPPGADAVLVDGGPPGAGLEAQLADHGVGSLAAVVATHEESDHVGGLLEVIAEREVGNLVIADPAPKIEAAAEAVGTPVRHVVSGDGFSAGPVSFEVLWPPPREAPLADPGQQADPNLRALVLIVRWRGFSMLLTADAEAESAPYAAPEVDLLKVAHHGSADAGLPTLLEAAEPALALISVGEDNPFGHPTVSTIAALQAASVPVLRTDLDGEIEITVEADGSVAAATDP